MNRSKNFLLWLLAFALIFLCIAAGRWQLSKGLNLSKKNSSISVQELRTPILNPKSIDGNSDQWKKYQLDGHFLEDYRLIKNQYQDGTFGYHVLQNFDSKSLGVIHVDRGWVKAGSTALTPPTVPKVNLDEDQIVVRLRSEFLNSHLGGTLFALPVTKPTIREIYFDLLRSKKNPPISDIQLPDLSTGPHFAYAFQWFAFALVILIGRLILRTKLNSKTN